MSPCCCRVTAHPHPRFKRKSVGKFSFYLLQIGLETSYLFIFARAGARDNAESSRAPSTFFNTFLHIIQIYYYYYISNPWEKPVKTHEPVSRVGVWWGYELPYPDPYPTYPTRNPWGVCEPVIFPTTSTAQETSSVSWVFFLYSGSSCLVVWVIMSIYNILISLQRIKKGKKYIICLPVVLVIEAVVCICYRSSHHSCCRVVVGFSVM